ncbi:hypothetical protein ACOME3_004757 [Neoechinorhynchus agilis]
MFLSFRFKTGTWVTLSSSRSNTEETLIQTCRYDSRKRYQMSIEVNSNIEGRGSAPFVENCPPVVVLRVKSQEKANRLKNEMGKSLNGESKIDIKVENQRLKVRIENEEICDAQIQKLASKVELYTTEDLKSLYKAKDVHHVAVDGSNSTVNALTKPVAQLIADGDESEDSFDDDVWKEVLKYLSEDVLASEVRYSLFDASGNVVQSNNVVSDSTKSLKSNAGKYEDDINSCE